MKPFGDRSTASEVDTDPTNSALRLMPCPSAEDVLAAADDDSPDAETLVIQRHMEACPRCQARWQADLQLVALAHTGLGAMRFRRALRATVALVLAGLSTTMPSEADVLLTDVIAHQRFSSTAPYFSVRVLPLIEGAPMAGCEPWLGMVESGRGVAAQIRPSAARRMVEAFDSDPLNPRAYEVWRARRAWPSSSVVARGDRQIRVRTESLTGPVRSAELLLRPQTPPSVIGLRLVGEACHVYIRAVEGSGVRRPTTHP